MQKMTIAEYKQKWVLSCPEEFKLVFDDIPNISAKYMAKVSRAPGAVVRNGALFSDDFDESHAKVNNGARRTVGAPEVAERPVYLLGPSYVYGSYCEDAGTIASHLQALCNESMPGSYIVYNYGVRGATLELYGFQLRALPLQPGDIVILISPMETHAWNGLEAWKFVKELDLLCNERQVDFCFFLYPSLSRLINPSPLERRRMSNNFRQLYNGTATAMDAPFPEKYELPDAIIELTANSCRCFDLQPWINRPHSMGEIYIDKGHLSGKGYRLIAKSVYDCFLSKITAKEPLNLSQLAAVCNKTFIDMVKRIYSQNQSIGEWLEEVGKQAFQTEGTIGAIVMNCNPFTVGHRHVIEQALEEVSSLYIFVVEEDLSDFSFADRLKLIQQGTADLGDRVRVLPSGKFIISSFTFPQYFEKTQLTTIKIDSSTDVYIFGSIIAPKLKITFRFIGEEPFCNVTNQYNATMKRLLPHMNITVREIPRYAVNHRPVSASRVRECLKSGDIETLRALVPPTTFAFLHQQMGEQKNIIFESKAVFL